MPGRNLGNLLSAIAAHLHHWRVLVEFVIRPNDLGGAEDGKLNDNGASEVDEPFSDGKQSSLIRGGRCSAGWVK
jgi:hypothetical protein